jgi:hypothetical protein
VWHVIKGDKKGFIFLDESDKDQPVAKRPKKEGVNRQKTRLFEHFNNEEVTLCQG